MFLVHVRDGAQSREILATGFALTEKHLIAEVFHLHHSFQLADVIRVTRVGDRTDGVEHGRRPAIRIGL